VKPFVNAVNESAKGMFEIKIHFSSSFGSVAEQAELVRKGTVDMAVVLPGYTPNLFPDNTIVEMPGLYRDSAEATAAYTGLVAENTLRGYEDFFVIGAFTTPPGGIHTRSAVSSLADLKGKRIRANNGIQKAALDKLGMIGVQMTVNQTADAIASGKIEGVTIPAGPLFDFGIARFVTNHYLLGVGVAPIAVLMNRKKFMELPGDAQDIIRKYSGEWAGQRFVTIYESENTRQIEKLKENPRRKTLMPSATDRAIAANRFNEFVSDWAANDPNHESLYSAALREIAKHRLKGQTGDNQP
jgi:TRAP-type C4-dicarboxylate transport system substrate-binding protein